MIDLLHAVGIHPQRALVLERDVEFAFVNEMAKYFNNGIYSPDEFRSLISDKIEHFSLSRDMIIRFLSFMSRILMELSDDKVLPTLARLTAEYLEKFTMGSADSLLDPFFKGFAGFMSNLTSAEFVELQRLCEYFATLRDNISYLYLDYIPGTIEFYDNGIPNTGLWNHMRYVSGGNEEKHIGQFAHGDRLGYLLTAYGFNYKPDKAISESRYGKILVHLDGKTAKRVGRLVIPD